PIAEPVPPPAVTPSPAVAPSPGGPVRPSLPSGTIGVMAGTRTAGAVAGQLPAWEPRPGETHPTHEGVEGAANETGSDCDAIAYAISVLIKDLKFRRWDMQRRGGGDRIHRDTYYLRRESLRRLIGVARAQIPVCRYDPDADQQVTLPHNHPTP